MLEQRVGTLIKLGNEPSEAAVLRVRSETYERREDLLSAIRCLERVVQIGARYRLPGQERDRSRLQELVTAKSTRTRRNPS